MAEQQSTSQTEKCVTVTVESDESDAALQQNVNTIRLKLRKPKSAKKVNWTEETVDNEHMDKKKSKCCCIYKKPRAPDESSTSEDDSDECEHCYGHVEKKKKTPTDNSNSETTDPNVPNLTDREDSNFIPITQSNQNGTENVSSVEKSVK